jgi:hypothetical protein
MKVIAAHADCSGEPLKARHSLGVLNEATGLLHGDSVLCGERRGLRSAPLARPKAGLFGGGAGRMELHMLASGTPGRA